MTNKLNEKPKQSKKKYYPHLRILDSTLKDSSCLSNAAFRVYVILRFHRNYKTGQCDPSVATLARECNFSKSSVESGLTELVKLGWISLQSGHGPGNSNKYTFPASATTIKIEDSSNVSNTETKPVATFDTASEEYLASKQQQFPDLPVKDIYVDFSSKCESVKYPKLKNTRTSFDKWLNSQHKRYHPDELEDIPFD